MKMMLFPGDDWPQMSLKIQTHVSERANYFSSIDLKAVSTRPAYVLAHTLVSPSQMRG